MIASKRAVALKTRKGRTVPVRPSTNLLTSNASTNTTDALRAQRLRLLGITGERAELIACLAWGDAA